MHASSSAKSKNFLDFKIKTIWAFQIPLKNLNIPI